MTIKVHTCSVRCHKKKKMGVGLVELPEAECASTEHCVSLRSLCWLQGQKLLLLT